MLLTDLEAIALHIHGPSHELHRSAVFEPERSDAGRPIRARIVGIGLISAPHFRRIILIDVPPLLAAKRTSERPVPFRETSRIPKRRLRVGFPVSEAVNPGLKRFDRQFATRVNHIVQQQPTAFEVQRLGRHCTTVAYSVSHKEVFFLVVTLRNTAKVLNTPKRCSMRDRKSESLNGVFQWRPS